MTDASPKLIADSYKWERLVNTIILQVERHLVLDYKGLRQLGVRFTAHKSL